MAERITPQKEDFSQWYQDIVLQARLADYSPVKGCMVIRPNGYAIWERIQAELDQAIKATGTQNAYFPVFIPESFLKKEADHVEGFAPQCAVVTHAGGKALEEKLVVRPTSETIINSMFSKWIQSYRDLPFLINQWANVVRWEMRTRLFLRTSEFLWQEGHTCHATLDEAEMFARRMLGVYQDFAHEVLAIPVIAGMKTQNERFAGALRTYCIEGMMQDKKALQAGTSHNLSDNFAKAFNTQYLSKEGKQNYVFQTSWGVSTRLIGAVVMTHSDDRGLVLPPRLATTHVVIVPILGAAAKTGEKVLAAAEKLADAIREGARHSGLPYTVGVSVDKDDSKQPGWKFHEYELIGIPLRIELGPRELEKQQAVLVRRDVGKKETVSLQDIPVQVFAELKKMQKDLLDRSKKFRDQNTYSVSTYDEFKKKLDEEGGFLKVSWNLDSELETKIKEETKATIRCIQLNQDFQPVLSKEPCFYTGKTGPQNVIAIFARNY